MSSGFGFLGGAKSRLLPPSLPFRFFAAAAAFHVLLWIVLCLVSDQLVSFRGGLAPALAGVHLLVLGVLTTTAVGAAAQLLPVATRRAFSAHWPIRLIFWTLVPGVALLAIGMYLVRVPLTVGGAGATGLGLLLFAALLARNLRQAGNMPVVAAYGWTALASLVGVALLGVALSLDFVGGFLPNHFALAQVHMILGAYGFMGLLALGFSHVLIPMFALSAAPARSAAATGFLLAAAALLAGATAAYLQRAGLLALAIVLGLAAVAIHLWLMQSALRSGMRRRQGISFALVRAGWVCLPLSLIVGLAAACGLAGPRGPALFGLLLVGGWLLSFLLGILQRILPFLASMHVASAGSAAPMRPSEFGGQRLLELHALCHGIALVGLAVGILWGSAPAARLACYVGLVGALAFGVFTTAVLRRVFGSADRTTSAAGGGRSP